MEDFADDDFGELYGDLEVLATPSPEQEQPQHDEEGVIHVKNNNVFGTDSDDLSIVLKNKDRRGFPAGRDENVSCDGLGKNVDCADHQFNDGSKLVSFNAHGDRSRISSAKGGYGSQFSGSKFTRTQGSKYGNNIKASKSWGPAYDCSSSSFPKGRGSRISSSSYFHAPCYATTSMAFLPWHWNMYGANNEKLEKPWMIPGANIVNYPNFGFNEHTWNQYCASLGQLWQTSTQIGIPVNGSAIWDQASSRERIDKAVSQGLLSPSSICEVPKGKAIRVENSGIERQPSIHMRHPRSIDLDSDVVIQVKVQESSYNNSSYANSIMHDLPEEGEFILGNNINKNNSSSEHDVLSEEQLEDVKKSEELSGQERNGLVLDVVKAPRLDEEGQHSEDAKVLDKNIKTRVRDGIGTCCADPHWSKLELSPGDQDLSLISYTDNDSEETEDSVHGDNENHHSHLVNSDTNTKESLSLYHKTSKNISFDRTRTNASYYSRDRGPVEQEWRHQSGRHMSGSKLKKHIENDNTVSLIPKFSGKDTTRLGHQLVNYKSKERPQYFDSQKRKQVSHDKETKRSRYHGDEKIVDNWVQVVNNEYSDREEGGNLFENANQYIRKNRNKREYLFEKGTLMKYHEDSEWHPARRKHFVDRDDPSFLSYKESRQFLPKHFSLSTEDREMQRRRMHHKPHFKDGSCDYDQWFDDSESEYLNKSYSMPYSFAEREMEILNNKHEEQFPHVDRALKRYAGRGRHHDRPCLGVDTLSGKPEAECTEYTHHQTSHLKYQRQSYTDSASNYRYRLNENIRGHERHKHAADRDTDWHYHYIDASEDEDCTTSPIKEWELYPLPYEVQHWPKDNFTAWHHDELHPEDDTFFSEETPWHERHARYGSLHARVRSDEIVLLRHQPNLSKRDRDNFLKRSSKVISRDHCPQAVLRCRKTVDLINREGKSHAKRSRVMCSNRLENVHQGIAKKRATLEGSDEDSDKKAIKFDISKSLCGKENKKLLQNHPDKGQKEVLDIEEGEIVKEEPSLEAYVSGRDVYEGATLIESVKKKKKRLAQTGNDSEVRIGNFDNQKILDTLAKMEKRRERFKQPVGMIKEAAKSLKLNTDSIVNIIDETKQQRPARKRRWNSG